MVRNDKDFLELDVVSLEDGMVLGTVDALLVDDHANVAGLVLDLGIYEANVLAYGDILSVGDDAIMVSTSDKVRLVSQHPSLEQVAELEIFVTDSLVMSDQGNLVGVVGDYYVDMATGAIKGLEVLPDEDSDPHEALLIPMTQVIRIAPELVMVRADFAQHSVPDPETL
jgi:uncharacterized protein YrrD